MKKFLFTALCATALFNTGCAPKLGGSDYNVADVGDVAISTPGIIVGKRVIQIHADNSGAGAGMGAVGGALLGSTIGGGRGSIVTAGLGGLAGGVAGHFAESALTHQEGFEYNVRVEKTGEVITVSQGAEPNIPVGAPVYIIESKRSDSAQTIHEGKKRRARIIPR